jgi:predicted nucleic acid-binding protein
VKYGYVDSSVIARIALDEPGKVDGLAQFSDLATSELTQVELRRVLDRYRLATQVTDDHLIKVGDKIELIKKTMTSLNLTKAVLLRAGHPLPVALGTLDAIHLASALIWQDVVTKPVTVITHDAQLAKAARMMNLEVHGA